MRRETVIIYPFRKLIRRLNAIASNSVPHRRDWLCRLVDDDKRITGYAAHHIIIRYQQK